MDKNLQKILNIIQKDRNMSTEEKNDLSKATKDTAKELARVSSKLKKTEKINQTTSILLDKKTTEVARKNRELEIEAALDRVRSRAMSMQKTDELLEAGELLYKELSKLGIKSLTSGYVLMDQDEKTGWNYLVNPDNGSIMSKPVGIPHTETKVMRSITSSWKKQKSFNIIELDPQETIDHQTFIAERSANFAYSAAELISFSPERLMLQTFNFKQGYLLIVGGLRLSDAELKIMMRFTKVFEMTYNRFLDLQKAEMQMREAKIELALEKVRARAMAMQSSNELSQLVDTVFKELNKLDFALDMCIINIIDEGDLSNMVWATNPEGGKEPESYYFKFEDYPFHHAMLKAWKERKTKWVYTIAGTEKKVYDTYLFNETEFSRFSKEVQKAYCTLEKYVASFSFSNFGGLQTIGDEPLSDTNLDILARFGKVFDHTYTRFNDLKQAEEQTREAEIELALERVRARTMAMQHSDELPEAANLLFLQVQSLGIPAWSAGYNILAPDKNSSTCWMSSEGEIQEPFELPFTEESSFLPWLDVIKNRDSFFVQELGGEVLIKHYDFLKTLPTVGETLQQFEKSGIALPTYQVNHLSFFTQGFLLFITYEPVPDAHDIFKRFTAVFEQTYTRFLDLQKAEEQARESLIEVALEKVRSRTLAMKLSEELPDVATVMFQQVKSLGISQWTCGFNIWELGDEDFTFYPGSPDGIILSPCKVPLNEHPIFMKFDESRKRGDELLIYEKKGEVQADHYRYMLSHPGGMGDLLQGMLDAGHTFPTFQIDHLANFSHGSLIFITYEHIPEMHDVFKRFAKVFEQTYTRFLDLQKAEEQAKEGQIEVALEKVRSRSMAMYKSEELLNVIKVVSQQMRVLNFKFDNVSFGQNNQEHDYKFWTSILGYPEPVQISVPFLDNRVINSLVEAHKNKVSFLINTFSPKESKEWFQHIINHGHLTFLPKAAINYVLNNSFNRSSAILQNIQLFVGRHGSEPFTDDENKIIARFAQVFEQSFTRFLDLQKAEEQAKEAVKQSSLDRVRAEIASMRTSADLKRITPLIWKELTTLGVTFYRCGVFIIEEDAGMVKAYLSVPTGESLAALHLDLDTNSLTKAVFKSWKAQKTYQEVWTQQQFVDYTKSMMELGQIKDPETFQQGKKAPEKLILHLTPFKQGMLYVGSTTSLSKEQIELVQSLADAFAEAYARYEDFNQLEDAKAEVENTLTDLKSAQSQLIQSEKMASLGELTAGIAHEIQNPLNFVTNFSEVSEEMLDELAEEIINNSERAIEEIITDIKQNLNKINHHGKRASSIVKGMLDHSRTSSGAKEMTDINVLADEYLRLAYHGLRAKDKSFQAEFTTDLDSSIPKISIIPQDLGRVILNLINNAFYTVNKKGKRAAKEYKPTVSVSTGKIEGAIKIIIKDNGEGISKEIADKIFQPFFTTKPTGEGTGLGLSLAYDIITKGHGGTLAVDSIEGDYTEFIIELPVKSTKQ